MQSEITDLIDKWRTAPASSSTSHETPHLDPEALTITLDRIISTFADSLSVLFMTRTSGTIDAIATGSSEEATQNALGKPAAIVKSTTDDLQYMIIIDERCLTKMAELAFGGSPTNNDESNYGPSTELNLELFGAIASLLEKALRAAMPASLAPFDQITPLRSLDDRHAIGAVEAMIVETRALLTTAFCQFRLAVLLPATMFRQSPSSEPANSSREASHNWLHALFDQIGGAPLTINAVLERITIPLEAVACLRVNDIIPLKGKTQGQIRLECKGRHLYSCKASQLDDYYSLEINDTAKSSTSLEQSYDANQRRNISTPATDTRT